MISIKREIPFLNNRAGKLVKRIAAAKKPVSNYTHIDILLI